MCPDSLSRTLLSPSDAPEDMIGEVCDMKDSDGMEFYDKVAEKIVDLERQ